MSGPILFKNLLSKVPVTLDRVSTALLYFPERRKMARKAFGSMEMFRVFYSNLEDVTELT